MFISKKLTSPTIGLVLLCFIFPFLADLQVPLNGDTTVIYIQNTQAVMLLAIVIYSYFYIRPDACADGKKQFWLWAIFWWIMLLGRSISWGRDFFPNVEHFYFRILSIFFIAPVVLMLFSKKLRQEIMVKFKTVQFPIYSFLLALVTVLIADSIEHSRFIAPIFLHDIAYKDFMEEMYEFPVIWGLFEVTYLLMKQEKDQAKQTIAVAQKEQVEDLSAYKNAH